VFVADGGNSRLERLFSNRHIIEAFGSEGDGMNSSSVHRMWRPTLLEIFYVGIL